MTSRTPEPCILAVLPWRGTYVTNKSFINYAEVYDTLYHDKDYERECDYITGLFSAHGKSRPVSILDIACSTGGHAIPLARRGFTVTAQDISSGMVDIGQQKADKLEVKITWHPGTAMQDFSLDERFDVIICPFSAIDYILTDDDLHKTFNNVHKHLAENGLFILDFWNAKAVEMMYSNTREKVGSNGIRTVKRSSSTALDRTRQLAHITMKWQIWEDSKAVSTDEEIHTCRYFDIEKMRNFLHTSGLHVLDMHPFLDPNAQIEHDTWNITAVCRAR